MLTSIIQQSTELLNFLNLFQLKLSVPQFRHLLQLVDALLVCNGKKTLTNLCRRLFIPLDPRVAADFFRESPWQREWISPKRKQVMLMQFLAWGRQLGFTRLDISLDDSLGAKDKATRHLAAVDWQHNHTEGAKKKNPFVNGYVYVEMHLQIGPLGFTWDYRLYLREKTVRRLNRQVAAPDRIAYQSKYTLVRAMLKEFAAQLPTGYQVYVLFDSWYASAKLIKYCRRQGWHVICALKSNRRIDKKRVNLWDQALKGKRYQRVILHTADPQRYPPVYYVRTLQGCLEEIAQPVCVILSRRHKGDRTPKYFMCTDLTLSAQEALRIYQRRWPVEVDNFYLKQVLGLGDFRLQAFRTIDKWFELVLLALNYVQFQQAQTYVQTKQLPTLAEVIRQHRQTHLQKVIRHLVAEARATEDPEAVVLRFMPFMTEAVT